MLFASTPYTGGARTDFFLSLVRVLGLREFTLMTSYFFKKLLSSPYLSVNFAYRLLLLMKLLRSNSSSSLSRMASFVSSDLVLMLYFCLLVGGVYET